MIWKPYDRLNTGTQELKNADRKEIDPLEGLRVVLKHVKVAFSEKW